jgi:hypothetical protein
VLEPAIDTGWPMGRMVLTVLGLVPRWSSASSVIGSSPASTPQRRRAFIRAARLPSIARIAAVRKERMGATESLGQEGAAEKRLQDAQRRGLTSAWHEPLSQTRDRRRAAEIFLSKRMKTALPCQGPAGGPSDVGTKSSKPPAQCVAMTQNDFATVAPLAGSCRVLRHSSFASRRGVARPWQAVSKSDGTGGMSREGADSGVPTVAFSTRRPLSCVNWRDIAVPDQ